MRSRTCSWIGIMAVALIVAAASISFWCRPVPPVKHALVREGQGIALWSKAAARPKGVILLVHGRTWSSLPDFDLQVPGEHRSVMDAFVEQGYSVYAIDLRGYGATPRDASGWNTPSQAAEDVAAALTWIAQNTPVRGRPALLGWSLGSTVAQLAAQRHPELVSALILTGYWWDPDNPIPACSDPSSPERKSNTAAAAASDFIAPHAISRRAIKAYVSAALKADPVRADWRRWHEFDELDSARVTVPTLMIQGEMDPAVKPGTLAKVFTSLGTRDKRQVILAGGDHAALLEDTSPRFVLAVVEFLERSQQRARP